MRGAKDRHAAQEKIGEQGEMALQEAGGKLGVSTAPGIFQRNTSTPPTIHRRKTRGTDGDEGLTGSITAFHALEYQNFSAYGA